MKIFTFEERLLSPKEREARRLQLQKDEEDAEYYRNMKEEDLVPEEEDTIVFLSDDEFRDISFEF